MSKECCKRWRFATGVATLSVLLLAVSVQAQERNTTVYDLVTGEVAPRQTVVDLRADIALSGPRQTIVSNQNRADGITAAGNIGEAVIYQNGQDSGFGVIDNYTAETGLIFPGTVNADNLGLAGGFTGEIARYEMAIFRSGSDPWTVLGSATDLHLSLWDGDPFCSVDTLGDGYACAEVSGSGADFTIPQNGLFLLSHTLPKGSFLGATNPTNRVWGTLSSAIAAPNPNSCRLFFILTFVKPIIGNDNPFDAWANQFDLVNGTLPQSCCTDPGLACTGAGGTCPFNGNPLFCSDGDADGAFYFTLGGPCIGDPLTDTCSNFLWNVFAPAEVTMAFVEEGTGNSEVLLEAGGVDVALEIVISDFDPNGNGTRL
ncbi:MAG: hypothetical protein IH897_11470, partial [Planctomycetes bacterium]|nr:hypothetical protein [Planctomycetota bacterium]